MGISIQAAELIYESLLGKKHYFRPIEIPELSPQEQEDSYLAQILRAAGINVIILAEGSLNRAICTPDLKYTLRLEGQTIKIFRIQPSDTIGCRYKDRLYTEIDLHDPKSFGLIKTILN